MSDIMLITEALIKEGFGQKQNHSGWGLMEDYHMAFLQRVVDVEKLHEAGRRTAAMHFGGVAIECYLKYLIFTSLPKDAKWEWKTTTNDPGHSISNPGHSYDAALKCHNQLKARVRKEKHVLDWLNKVENPDGHFIDIRYVGKEPDDAKYKLWWQSYQRLIHWLRTEGTKSVRRK